MGKVLDWEPTSHCLLASPSHAWEPCYYGDGEENAQLGDHWKNIAVGYTRYFKLTRYFCHHFTIIIRKVTKIV